VRRIWPALLCAFVGVPALYVGYEAASTLAVLTRVEQERDQWQRPSDVVEMLALGEGSTVVDFGCGAGYFALKLSSTVGTTGTVLATDIRRESLAFLWIRAVWGRHRNLQVIHGEPDDPRLPPGLVDAILISNAFHELTSPARTLDTLSRTLKPGGRIVVLDRGPRASDGTQATSVIASHGISPASAEHQLHAAGLAVAYRDDRFIDRPGDDDVWWIIVARKP
jgi:ubiquinone/menaquinone biosynthesis C-methylase UbiE